MKHAIRSFLAIDLTDPLRSRIAEIVQVLGALPNGDRVKWMPARNLHLTLRFLGEAQIAALPDLITALRRELVGMTNFDCRLQDVRVFPSGSNPKVIAIAIDAEGQLTQLAAAVDRGARAAGFPGVSQAFRAHLTIGRLRGHGFPSLHDDFGLAECIMAVDEVVLFKSDLAPAVPVYTRIEAVRIGQACGSEELSQSN